ncbi:hypothetical protein [Pantoea anthophila]|uniref:hypothetical protein n=1 Tax=Pantoea anthophila TaxID=470931 RepID=UPI002DB81191|nr:hypothetical protein [Pantoea anthophila]MEB5707368.1 hypothetical protein [Pantoea anthophila]MEB6518239.1 hypothetical protein [Pantoea anthophila]
MTTKIIVINRALVKLGEERLMSETDNNKASRTIEAIYDGLLESLLRDYRWAFSIKRAKLSALSDAPAYGYSHQYQLPADFLRMDEVLNSALMSPLRGAIDQLRDSPWQIEGRKILTDIEAPLHLRYGAKVTDPSQWDSSFAEAFACLLAYEMSESITQSSTKKQAAGQDFETAIKAARAASAIERPRIRQQETSWLTSRL